jgi:drug/metabolite transporter (DMT)-like permease
LFVRIIEPMKSRTASAFAAVGILWGSAWIPTSIVVREMPGLRIGALRFAIAAAFAVFLGLLARLRNRNAAQRKLALPLRDSIVLGLTALALPYTLTAYAAGNASSGTVAVLFAFMPLAALLLSREVMSAAIPALVIGLGGVAFLVAQGLSVSAAQVKGVALTGCAVLLAAFSLNYAKVRLHRSDLLASVSVQFGCAATFLGSLSAVIERGRPATWNQETLLPLLVLGVAVSGLSLPLMYWLLRELESWQVASLQWTATLVAVAESAWLLRATPSMDMWTGAALIVGATVWLLRWSGSREAVTLQITSHTSDAPAASESEVGSK